MGKTLLKMQISTTTMVLDGKETIRKGKSKHVHVQGMWFKSLDLKTTSREKLAIWNFQKTSCAQQKDMKSPNPNF